VATSPVVEACGTQASCARAQRTFKLEARESNEDERCGGPRGPSGFRSLGSIDAMDDRSLDMSIVEQVIGKK